MVLFKEKRIYMVKGEGKRVAYIKYYRMNSEGLWVFGDCKYGGMCGEYTIDDWKFMRSVANAVLELDEMMIINNCAVLELDEMMMINNCNESEEEKLIDEYHCNGCGTDRPCKLIVRECTDKPYNCPWGCLNVDWQSVNKESGE